MKTLYCSNCGIQLRINRKALPNLGIILDLVEPHTCLEVPIDPSKVIVVAPIIASNQSKFVESLNGLKSLPQPQSEGRSLRPSLMTGTDNLRDRRFDGKEVPSTAPPSILDQIKSMSNSIPVNEVKEELTDDAEMGG
jgi:hypothetical protein